MGKDPGFDTVLAHRFFAADCFNKTWELIEKPNRTREEDEQMIRLAQASLWHWTNRADCKSQQLSIGYWLLARVYALAGRSEESRRYAESMSAAQSGRSTVLCRDMPTKRWRVRRRWPAIPASWRNTRRKLFDLQRPSKTPTIGNS